MHKVKISFYATNMFNREQVFALEEVMLQVPNGAIFDKYLKAETEAFRASIPALQNKLFGEYASQVPLLAHVDFDVFVDEDAEVDVIIEA